MHTGFRLGGCHFQFALKLLSREFRLVLILVDRSQCEMNTSRLHVLLYDKLQLFNRLIRLASLLVVGRKQLVNAKRTRIQRHKAPRRLEVQICIRRRGELFGLDVGRRSP